MRQNSPESSARSDGRIPRGAIVVVIIGVIASLGVFGLSKKSGGSSADLDWDTKEVIKTPVLKKLGRSGTFRLARTSISAITPNAGGELVYRVSGVVTVDSGGLIPTLVSCDISTTNGGDSKIARTPKLRAAWPRPSDILQKQAVPEASVVKFHAVGAAVLGLPIRDVFRRYTDSAAPTEVSWEGYKERIQHWAWTMDRGTGPGPAALGYSVVFKTTEQPTGWIECDAELTPKSGKPDHESIKARVKLRDWPIPDEDGSAADAETGADATDVE